MISSPALSAIWSSKGDKAKLKSGMLFAEKIPLISFAIHNFRIRFLPARRMVEGDVGHLAVPAKQVGGLPVDVQDGQLLVPLEHVQPPLSPRFPSLRRLAVLHHGAAHRVGILGQGAREPEVHALLLV